MFKHLLSPALFVLLFVLGFGCQKKNMEIDNLTTFGKAYGYVKYFHPGDEAAEINWNTFAIYGANEVVTCKNRKELVNTLNSLFTPFAPSVKFVASNSQPEYDLKAITPEEVSKLDVTHWQHLGVGTGMIEHNKLQIYKSMRINRPNNLMIFSDDVEFGEIITKEIGDGIYCQVPLSLYCNYATTFPVCDSTTFSNFKVTLRDYFYLKTQKQTQLGNVINVYNVFQHFYPYFDEIDVDWDKEFKKALQQSFLDETKKDHLITLRKFTAPLKDGHISVSNSDVKDYYIPSLSWEWIEGKLVITKIAENFGQIKVGDVVTQINGEDSKKYFEEIYSTISAGTDESKRYKGNTKSLMGALNTTLTLEINGKDIEEVNRNMKMYQLKSNNVKIHEELEEGIWYLNFDKIEIDKINSLMPELEKSKAIICDLRGYPNGNHDFIRHLLPVDDTTKAWMQIPRTVYPDRENIVGYYQANWIRNMKRKEPYLGDKNIVFITDGRAISYAESFMGYIEGYNLATIVGESTAGTNGNINRFKLPGGYNMVWTGMNVRKHNGSQHHAVGIKPDVFVEKTIQGVIDARDEFLEKALEIARQNKEVNTKKVNQNHFSFNPNDILEFCN